MVALPFCPEIRHMPAIIQFLGYNPLPEANSTPERLAEAKGCAAGSD